LLASFYKNLSVDGGSALKREMEIVELRPTFVSFPSPKRGHSPQQRAGSDADGSDGHPGTSSLFGAIANTTNYFIGVGILGLPYAFKISGWIGVPVLIFLGCVMDYSGILLGRCQKYHSLSTYPDIAEVCIVLIVDSSTRNQRAISLLKVIILSKYLQTAYGKIGRRIVSLVFYSMLLADTTLFFVLIVTSVQSLLLQTSSNFLSLSDTGLPCTIAILIILLANMFTNMQSISFLSAVGTISSIAVCLVLIVLYGVCINSTEGIWGAWLSNTDLWRGPKSLSKSVGIFSFSYMGHQVLIKVRV
jgi:amino acid permease